MHYNDYSMKRNFLLLSLFFFFVTSLAWSQDFLSDPSVRVKGVTYLISENRSIRAGLTREPALKKFYDINVGDYFESREELEKKLELVTRNLNTQQIYKDISYEVSYWYEKSFFNPSQLTAHITIAVEDSLSLYLFPFALYDSNLGMVFGGNFSYDNVLGTLTNLSISGYGGTETWQVGGVWESVPLGRLKGDFSLYCQQERTRRVDDDDKTVLEYTNLLLDTFMKIDYPLAYGWKVSFQPQISFPFNYDLVSWDPFYGREEFDTLVPRTSLSIKESLVYANILWEENFRIGLEGSASLEMESYVDEWEPVHSVEGSVSAFYRPLSFLGMGHHVSAFYVFNGIREGAGSYMRGVLDHLMYGEWGVYLNNNVDVRAISLAPVVEIHCYPLIDFGLVCNSSTPYEAYDYRLAAGFGITFFPLFLQSLQLNVEAGYDLFNKGRPEITFKSELFF